MPFNATVIDVSVYQGSIDWQQVKAAGIYAVELPASGKYYVKIAGGWATANVYNVTLTKRE